MTNITTYIICCMNENNYPTFISVDKKSAVDWINPFTTLKFTSKRKAIKELNEMIVKYPELKNTLSIVTWKQGREMIDNAIKIQLLDSRI